jgi:excisionase family DNA binding protein
MRVQTMQDPPIGARPVQVVPDERLYTYRQVCVALGIEKSKFYELVASGELRAVRMGRQVRVRPDQLRSYIESLPEA